MRLLVATVACALALPAFALAQGSGEAPDTVITSGTTITSARSATFTFSSPTQGASFECHVDFSTGFLPCSSPLTLNDMRPGVHVLVVRAVADGVADPSPASHFFGIAPPCRGFAPTMVVTEDKRTRGTNGTDVIVVIGGEARIDARGGNDLVCIHVGAHDVDAGVGNDFVQASSEGGDFQGGSGGDFIRGGDSRDQIAGGEGRDRLLGRDGADSLNGGTDGDRCNGGPGADHAMNCEMESSIP